jgi:hypothetical protein
MEGEMPNQKGGKIQIASCIRTSFHNQSNEGGRSPSKVSDYSQYASLERQNISYSDVYTNKSANGGQFDYLVHTSPQTVHPKGSPGNGGSRERRGIFEFDNNERELRNPKKVDLFDEQFSNYQDQASRKDR